MDVRVSNRGRGRPQAARDAKLVLVADDGHRFEAIAHNPGRSLRSQIQAGESIDLVCRYEVPTDVEIIGIDVVHGAWPQLFIVGDCGSLFHKRPYVRAN